MTNEELKAFGALAQNGPGVAKDDPIGKLGAEVAKSGDAGKAKQLAELIVKDTHFVRFAMSGGEGGATKIATQLLNPPAKAPAKQPES